MNGPRLFVGIDPGASGGIAAITADGLPHYVSAMPSTIAGVLFVLERIVELSSQENGTFRASAVLERVRAGGLMGKSQTFSFGRGVGHLEALLVATGIPYREVTPKVWHTAMGTVEKSGGAKFADPDRKKKDKSIAKRKAAELFPSLAVTLKTADALLIAEYARRSALRISAKG